MKSIHLLKKLERFPLFTENDVAKMTNKSPEYVKTLLYRLNRQNLIKRIEKGKYTVYDDPMLFSSRIITPSYFSLWTAFRFYNMTQQQPYGLFVVSAINKKKLSFQNTEIMFFKTKHPFGYKKERYADFDIFMAEKEKAIIDALLFKIPLQDIVYALDSEGLNFEKLAEYAKKTNNISLIKRLGYLLQAKKEKSYGLKALDHNYIPLDYFNEKKGKKDRSWRLIINTDL